MHSCIHTYMHIHVYKVLNFMGRGFPGFFHVTGCVNVPPRSNILGTGDISRHPDCDIGMLAGCFVMMHGMVLYFGILLDILSGLESLIYMYIFLETGASIGVGSNVVVLGLMN